MGIWDRLGNVIKSYLNSEDEQPFRGSSRSASGDPDLDAAFDELNDYLNWNTSGERAAENERAASASGNKYAGTAPSEELRPDFAALGVPFGASAEECKAAYKKLLKIHHPDRHAGHAGNFIKATEKTARINAAYGRIEQWRKKP